MQGRGELGIGDQLDAARPQLTGFGNHRLAQGPTDTQPLHPRRNRHFSQLIHAVGLFDEATSTHQRLGVARHQNVPAMVQNMCLRIVKHQMVRSLEGEVARNPLMVQGPKGGVVSGLKINYGNAGGHGKQVK